MANVAKEQQQQQQRAPPPGEDPEQFWKRQAAGDAAMQVIWKQLGMQQQRAHAWHAAVCHASPAPPPQAKPQAPGAGGPALFGHARGIGSPWGNCQLRQGPSTLHMALTAIDQPCAIVVAC